MAGRIKAGVKDGPAEALAQFLRRLRRRPDGTETTYMELAERLGGRRYCSAATLSRADRGGDCVPRLETVVGYVEACNGSASVQQHARRLLNAARRRRQLALTARQHDDPKAGARIARQRQPAVAPHPDYMRTPLDFQNGLRFYRHECGSASVRAISCRAAEAGYRLPKSTVQRILSEPRAFPSWEQVEAILVGCRPTRLPNLGPWQRAWQRVFSRTVTSAQHGAGTGVDVRVGELVIQMKDSPLISPHSWAAPPTSGYEHSSFERTLVTELRSLSAAQLQDLQKRWDSADRTIVPTLSRYVRAPGPHPRP